MLPEIKKPTLLVNEQVVRRNIRRMVKKTSENGLTLRPHFKTHQSAAIGEWFLDAGVTKAAVSSVEMARYFAKTGWKDITIAFPYNPLECDEINSLAKDFKLNVLIASSEALKHLNTHVNASVEYYLKVDVGNHRTGVLPSMKEEIHEIAQSKNENHRLAGLIAHAGHAYKPLNFGMASKLFNDCMEKLLEIKRTIGRSDLKISYGDTPTCSILDHFPQVHELRPGNFVFYDVMQHTFNACDLSDIGVCLACPIVSVHPDRNEAVVYGGAVHLSKNALKDDTGEHYGLVVSFTGEGWSTEPVAIVDRLSQEHGILKGSSSFINSLKTGDLVGILPVHSCLTADLQGYYVSLTGEKLPKLNRAT